MTDAELLQQFAGQNSETAFRTLVERHLPLVFGTARRITQNNALAEDIAQTVFILLARKADRLSRNTNLSGWLYRSTRFVTSRALTAEQRRWRREQEAVIMQTTSTSDPSWLRLGPQLDDAIARLGDTDRQAILLRYFEQQSLRNVGVALGLNEDAAKKRVGRALEKLRRTLSRRGFQIPVVALAAGLATEASDAATALPPAGKISAVVFAHGSAGAGVAAGSALLKDVMKALRRAKIINATAAAVALVAVALVVPSVAHQWHRRVSAITSINSSSVAGGPGPRTPAAQAAARTKDAAGTSRSLLMTVLDADTGQPVSGAVLTPYVNGVQVPEYQQPFRTGADGVAKLPIPENVPGGERANYIEIPVNAPGYTTRIVRWAAADGSVLEVVAHEHTVKLSRGISLSGSILDDAGKPLAGIRIGAYGSSFEGETATLSTNDQGLLVRTPAFNQDDYSLFHQPLDASRVVTDASGRFTLEQYPGDVRALRLDLLGPDGATHKFQTLEEVNGERSLQVSISELKHGTARLVVPRGVNVEGLVVNSVGVPIAGAEIVEATQYGNLHVLSKNQTDAEGKFCLSNRPLHEVLLGVSAEGSASLSTIVSIRPGMAPVRLQLPPELPLHGRVVDETGFAVSGAEVSCPDYVNPGFCTPSGYIESYKTDSNGQFVWGDAPTNELALAVSAPGMATRIVRLRASTNEALITLHAGNNDTLHITGRVTDAETGFPLDHFQMKISHQMMVGGIPMGPTQNFDGTNGEMKIELSRKDFPVGMEEGWMMTVEVEGYDAALSRMYQLEEGDQKLDFKLKHGGIVKGVVRTPTGEPTAGAQLAFTTREWGSIPSHQPGKFSRGITSTASDANGCFEIKKPLLAKDLVVLHDAGWAVVPVTAGVQNTDVSLSPWARIEGTVTMGNAPAPGRDISLEDLTQQFSDSLMVSYNTKSDENGHFAFDKLPAGIFKLSCRADSGKQNVYILQTSVSLAAGETRSVEMAASGRNIVAQLKTPPGMNAINWSNALATLSTDVQVPSEPAYSDFISDETYEAARLRYFHDPAILAALAGQRTFAGSVGPDGTVDFQQVPPGNYLLEVKLFDPSSRPPQPNLANETYVVLAGLRAAVTVPAATDNSSNDAPAALGNYTLEPL